MSTKALLYSLIDQSQPQGHTHVLDPNEMTIGDPMIDISTGHNTKIQLTAIPGSGYSGSMFVFYSRESIGNVGLPTQTLSEVNFTVESILDWLNQRLLVKLDMNDLQSFTLPVLNVGDILTIQLVAKSESVAWIGSTEIALLYGLPPNVGELSTIMNVDLPRDFN